MKNHIHIFGASGSGTTTLGRELARQLPHVHLDSDDYFWSEKFTKPRLQPERIELLTHAFKIQRQWILSGAICGWGDGLKNAFDLVVFLYVPSEVRLQRLEGRELERYGKEALPGGRMHKSFVEFMEWASMYDHGGPEIRSLALHQQWMKDLACPILKIEGEQTVEERIRIIVDYLKVND